MFIGKKTLTTIAVLLLISALFIAYCTWQNNDIVTTEITVESEKIPASFDGYRVVQISDVHAANFGENNSRLIEKLREARPDVIVITGDIINWNTNDFRSIENLLLGAKELCEVYFSAGNHEISSKTYAKLVVLMEKCGVKILDDETVILSRGEEHISLTGMTDVSRYYEDHSREESYRLFSADLKKLCEADEDAYNIVLSHRPDLIELYEKCGAELVFSGHAHGGQFRLPFIGGLYAPNQGFFPKYTAGAYELNDMTLIVNRGLGKSAIPFRINNRPEITAVTLKSK